MNSIKIKDLPLSIRKLVKQRYSEEKNGGEYSEENYLTQMITFSNTPEKWEFWRDVNEGDFSVFYKRYPMPPRYAIKASYFNTKHHPEFEDYYRSIKHRKPLRSESTSQLYIHNNGVEISSIHFTAEEIDIIDWINWKNLEEIGEQIKKSKKKDFCIDSYDYFSNY